MPHNTIATDSPIVIETVQYYHKRKKEGATMRECAIVKANAYKVDLRELMSAIGRRQKGMRYSRMKKVASEWDTFWNLPPKKRHAQVDAMINGTY